MPIKHEVNGDVDGATSGVSEGVDLDPADQTLVEEVSVIHEIAVSGVSAFRLEPFSTFSVYFGFWVSTLFLLYPFRFFCFRLFPFFFFS